MTVKDKIAARAKARGKRISKPTCHVYVTVAAKGE